MADLFLPTRRGDERRGATVCPADETRRVPNLALAVDSLLWVVIPDVAPLRTPFRGGTACRSLVVTGFLNVSLSVPQVEEDNLDFLSDSLTSSSLL